MPDHRLRCFAIWVHPDGERAESRGEKSMPTTPYKSVSPSSSASPRPHVPPNRSKVPGGPASAKKLGYDPHEIDTLPTTVRESFCGVGTPLGLGGTTYRPDRAGPGERAGSGQPAC